MVGNEIFENVHRVIVFGAGKATCSMWRGLRQILAQNPKCEVRGWINVPDYLEWNDCEEEPVDSRVVVHRARPVGSNEPTLEAMQGTERMVELLSSCDQGDLAVGLISGGGSALLPLPPKEISLEDKLFTTRLLAASGSTIHEINAVRRCLSRSKAGGLARACSASRMATLILSDVLDDSLETIASGPTDLEHPARPHRAWEILSKIDPQQQKVPKSVWRYLSQRLQEAQGLCPERRTVGAIPELGCCVRNFIVGNNGTAVIAAKRRAQELGLEVVAEAHTTSEGEVADYARHIAVEMLSQWLTIPRTCWISGGETYVTLPSEERRGLGGRNMHLALCLLRELIGQYRSDVHRPFIFLSAGTDGEDGPTSAAGAWIDSDLLEMYAHRPNELLPWIERCDSFHFFETHQRLFFSGTTHTNVCDLRILSTG